MEANDWDDNVFFTGDRESVISTPVQVLMEKDVEQHAFCGDPLLNQVASMPYRHCRVSVFKKADRFFYEPIVLLEEVTLPKQERRDGQVEVTFTIKLWNYDLERRIINYLRSEIGEVRLKTHQVQVMPYKEVQLIAKENTTSFRVLTKAVCLLQLPVEVTFKIHFLSDEEADFSKEFLAEHLELHFTSQSPQRLEGTAKKIGETAASLHRDSAFRVHRNSVFGINIVGQSIGSRKDEEAIAKNFWLEDVLSTIKNVDERINGLRAIQHEGCVPVFGASKYSGISKAKYVTFAEMTLPAADTHGVFDKTTGLFTAKSSGMYLFQFEGLPCNYDSIKMQLKVNGIKKAESLSCRCGPIYNSNNRGYGCGTQTTVITQSGSVSVSCLLPIRSEDQIGIVLEAGELSQSFPEATRFWGILLAGDERDTSI